MGMGGIDVVKGNLGGWPNIDIQTKQANEVKFEVSKGLAKTIASPLQISDKVIEIIGENALLSIIQVQAMKKNLHLKIVFLQSSWKALEFVSNLLITWIQRKCVSILLQEYSISM